MKKLKVVILIVIISITLIGCETAEEKALKEERNFIQKQYVEAIFDDSLTNTDARDFVEENEDKYIRWTAHIKEIKDDDYFILKEDDMPEIRAKFSYEVNKDNKYKVGDLITFSGHLKKYIHGLLGTTPVWEVKDCRIEELTEEDNNIINEFYNKKEEEEKEKAELEEKLRLEEEERIKLEEEIANKIISEDYISFYENYSLMTDLQKDDYFKEIENKFVQWSGVVVDVYEDSIAVKCLDSTITFDYIAHFSDSDIDDLRKINKGDLITIKGRIYTKDSGGIFGTWGLINSVIVN